MTCKCDPNTWFITPPPVCKSYQPGVDGVCNTCEHDKDCHSQQTNEERDNENISQN